MRMDSLPKIINGQFEASEVIKLKGAPGLVSEYGLTSFSVAGEARAAWISQYGIYQTNGHEIQKLSGDLDWSAFAVQRKLNWVLHWDADRLMLIFCFSTVNNQPNDRYILFHMDPLHQKENGLPKWTGQHHGDINHLASAQSVNGIYRLYSAHISNGKVYLENNGTTDASNAFDGSGTNPLSVKSRRMYNGWEEYSVMRANLRHTSFGAGQTVTVDWTVGRDPSGNTETKSQSVSLNGQQGTEFDVARNGEWHEYVLTHTGAAVGGLLDMRYEADVQSRAGKVGT